MTTRRFIILEQYDGRYLLVCPPFQTSMGWDSKAEVLIDWVRDVRSISTCYAEVAEYMVESGSYLEGPAQIEFVRYPVEHRPAPSADEIIRTMQDAGVDL